MILDTSALSALADGDPALGSRLGEVPILSVPVIVIGEYLCGVSGSRHRTAYERWLDKNLPIFDILSIDRETAEAYGRLRRELKNIGKPMPENDVWIAALARQYELPVVSRDNHFSAVPGIDQVFW